jgi:hypothetical protein
VLQRKIRIFLVDDESDNSLLYKTGVEQNGFLGEALSVPGHITIYIITQPWVVNTNPAYCNRFPPVGSSTFVENMTFHL